MKRFSILAAVYLISSPVLAADIPTTQEQLSQAKIQIGQLLIAEGNLELQLDRIQTENAALKKQIDAAKPERKDTPHVP